MASYHISTKQQREEWGLNNAYCKRINNPTPANPYRFNGKTLDRNGIAVPNGWKHITVESQSHCRGEFPRVYLERDYNHERGEFPQKEQSNASTTVDHEVGTDSPPSQGGKESAAQNQTSGTVSRGTRVPGRNGHANTAVVPGSDSRNPLHKEWEKLNDQIKKGEAVMVPTPPIPRAGGLRVIENPLTDHEAVNPAVIKYIVMDLLEGPIPSYHYRDVWKCFQIKEGLTANCLIFFHKDRPGTFVVIGYWTLIPGGRHRWQLNKGFDKRLEELYTRLGLPIVERVKEALPV